MKRIGSVLMAVVLVLLAFVPVSAVQPVMVQVWSLGPGPDDDWALGDEFVCDGYPIMDNEVGSGGITVHFDKNGVPVKVVGEWSGVDHLYTDGSDIVLSGKFGWKWAGTEFIGEYYGEEPLMRNYVWRGVAWNINAPGMPNLYHDVGSAHMDFTDRENPVEVKGGGLFSADVPGLCKALGF